MIVKCCPAVSWHKERQSDCDMNNVSVGLNGLCAIVANNKRVKPSSQRSLISLSNAKWWTDYLNLTIKRILGFQYRSACLSVQYHFYLVKFPTYIKILFQLDEYCYLNYPGLNVKGLRLKFMLVRRLWTYKVTLYLRSTQSWDQLINVSI